MALGVRLDCIKVYQSDLKKLVFSSIAFQILETKYGHSTVACDKMKDVLELILCQSINIFPKPSDNLVIGGAVRILDVIFEVF